MLDTATAQLYQHLPNDPEQRFRGRLMLGILSTLISADLVVLIYFYFFAHTQMDAGAIDMAVMVMSVGIPIHLTSLLMLLRGFLLTAAWAVVVIATSAIWLAVWLTSGVPDSPALPLLLAPVVLAFCLLGPRTGIAVALATVLVMSVQWYGATMLGWNMPALQSRRNPSFDATLIAGVNSFIVIAVLLVYELLTARLREQLGRQASRDELTGVGNRRDFMARLAQACARCNRSGQQLAVFYLDLNGFKQINDRFGHQTGDQVLMAVAERLRSGLRLQDIVARLGGDEFAVITEPRPGENYLEAMESKLRQTISEPAVIGGHRLSVGVSVGIALYPADGTNPEELLRHADTAMYREKKREQA